MNKNLRMILLASMVLGFVCLNSAPAKAENGQTTTSNVVQPVQTMPVAVTTNAVAPSTEVPVSTQTGSIQAQAPTLTTPVVEDTTKKGILKPTNRKVNLHAIIFDPTVTVKQPENADEMTKADLAKYDIEHALHGEVSVPSTKGLLEDTMKMTFEKGPIESLAPWIDFNSCFGNYWTGDNYTNTLYGLNFQDVGINGKFRTNDDPKSGKKTVFRLMYNTGKSIDGNSYLQSFMADNYIMRYWTKDDQILLGYARAAVGIEGGESPFTIPFFARSQISRTYGNVRTLGIKAQGNHKWYDYSAGIFSSGRYFHDFFPGPEFVGLASIKPLAFTDGKWGKITMGGSLNSGSTNIGNYCVAGTHFIYEYKRLKATAEYATADGSNGSTGYTSNQSEGFYGTLAYRLTPRIQLVGRYDQFDPNINKANDIRREYTAGVNYFVHGQALKLMLNYVLYSVENGTYGSRIMTGMQVVL
jgi:hypothetical protein